MSKEEVLNTLNAIENDLSQLGTYFGREEIKFIQRKKTRREVQAIAKKWFEEIEPVINQFGVPDTIKKKYHGSFTRLLELSLKKNVWKKTYQKVIEDVLDNFKDDVLVVVMKSAGKILSTADLAKILENVTEEEKEYLNEALGCTRHGFFRGSMVLVWSAAIHRMQKVVEKLGFDKFNEKSEEMKNISDGRFKRFNKSFNIHSLSELRATVFDTDLLWVLEYWGLIDANQHQRLSICLTMRNNAAHPGEAPISEVNLASAFSDLKNIIFDNPKFELS
jgi:23S rRNA pseudoU1915 N3-methylase RlmH